MGAEAKGSNVDLRWEVDPDIQIVTEADALRQILINLLLNAIRAVPEQGVVTVSLAINEDTPRTASVTVADTGKGMPADMIASLVSGKVDALPQERSLGIWMVSNLVDQIGARLSVSSEEGQGTAVTIILPQPAVSEATTP